MASERPAGHNDRVPESSTFAEKTRQPAHRSLWRRVLEDRAGALVVQDYLVEQANLRGHRGAWSRIREGATVDGSLDLEDIVVGLLMPHAPVEGRVVKLVLRILQSGDVEPGKLVLRARRERAVAGLHWILQMVPEGERTEAVVAVERALGGEPRGYRPPDYDYDPRRLIRRRFSKDELWKTRRR